MSRLLTLTLLVILKVFDSEAAQLIAQYGTNSTLTDCKNATKVILKNITINEIPKNYFKDLDLCLLRITNSRLLKIDEEAFDGQDHLNLLELSNDEITRIEPKTFARLKGLELLHLNSNKLQELYLVINHVQEIVLAHNEVKELQENFIIGDSVTFIDLSSNKLRHLVHSMRHLSKLSTINISNNNISYIAPAVFSNNQNLIGVYASGNQLVSTDGLKLKKLKTLDISSNRLTRLDNNSFAEMSFLAELLLNNNQITDINDAFSQTKNLRFLDLSDNLLSEIVPDWFRNTPYLSKLQISKNRIKTLSPFTNNLRHLTVLDLSKNNLDTIDADFFKQVDKLEILDLSFNKLKKLDMLGPLTSLVKLDLSSNHVTINRDTTSSNLKLSSLNISSNELDLSLSFFEKNSQLRNLDISRNNITNFCDMDSIPLDSLVSIDLSYNQIKNLNCFKTRVVPFSIIDIRHNPLTCDHNLDDVIAHFILTQSGPPRMQTNFGTNDFKEVYSAFSSFSAILHVWNSIKRELCPNGFDIHITRVLERLDAIEKSRDNQELTEYDNYSDYDYYENSSESDETNHGGSRESSNDGAHLDIEVQVEDLPGKMQELDPQSEKESWKKVYRTENIAEEQEKEIPSAFHINKSQLSLFTISLIFIGVSLILVLTNAIIFLFMRMHGWKRDFRTVQKYSHLENQVYKETTIPNDYGGADGGKNSTDNYKINCARIFTNYGFRGDNEADTESVKKMIVDTGKIDI